MDRRQFLSRSVLLPAAGAAASPQAPGSAPGLREKFFGCIVGCHVGSAMGAPCEGWTYDRIEARYGAIDRLLPYQHYSNGWNREPGTTEDGVERQKLMITAIIEKKDRVTAEDVRKIWARDIKPEAAGMISEPFETQLLAMAKSGIPACDLGRYCDYAGLNSFSRSCHPIGLINAGDAASAAEDVFEVGQLYQTTNSRGLQWASVTAVGDCGGHQTRGHRGKACWRPCARETPRFAGLASQRAVVREIDRGLKLIETCRDFREARKAFDSVYSGTGTPYAFSSANEVVTKAICIFKMVQGNPKDAMLAAGKLRPGYGLPDRRRRRHLRRAQRRGLHPRRVDQTGGFRHLQDARYQLAPDAPGTCRRAL